MSKTQPNGHGHGVQTKAYPIKVWVREDLLTAVRILKALRQGQGLGRYTLSDALTELLETGVIHTRELQEKGG